MSRENLRDLIGRLPKPTKAIETPQTTEANVLNEGGTRKPKFEGLTLKVKAGVGQKLDSGDNPTFEQWMKRCDDLCIRARGVSIHDLPDVTWRDWYDQRLRPIRAVNKALKNAGADMGEAINETISPDNIYSRMVATGVKIDGHESDLYVPVTPETQKIIADYEFKSIVTTFKSNVDGKLWYDIPFAYQPWWDKRAHPGEKFWAKGPYQNEAADKPAYTGGDVSRSDVPMVDRMKAQMTKVAVIRDPNVPAGQPAPMHFNCPCGGKPPVGSGVTTCKCGNKYDSRGWLIKEAATPYNPEVGDPEVYAAWRAWRKAADRGYGDTDNTIEHMRQVDARIRALQQKWEKLAMAKKAAKKESAWDAFKKLAHINEDEGPARRVCAMCQKEWPSNCKCADNANQTAHLMAAGALDKLKGQVAKVIPVKNESGFITPEEKAAARENAAKGRLCYRCGGPTGKETGQKELCEFCKAAELRKKLKTAESLIGQHECMNCGHPESEHIGEGGECQANELGSNGIKGLCNCAGFSMSAREDFAKKKLKLQIELEGSAQDNREKKVAKADRAAGKKEKQLSSYDCVEGDGRKATHLHGGHMGLEPCCGQHEDCGDDMEESKLSEADQMPAIHAFVDFLNKMAIDHEKTIRPAKPKGQIDLFAQDDTIEEPDAKPYHSFSVHPGGRKYLRIINQHPGSGRSVYCFVDLATGDIYKPAGWKAPALNFPRGNVNNPGSYQSYNPYGVPYSWDMKKEALRKELLGKITEDVKCKDCGAYYDPTQRTNHRVYSTDQLPKLWKGEALRKEILGKVEADGDDRDLDGCRKCGHSRSAHDGGPCYAGGCSCKAFDDPRKEEAYTNRADTLGGLCSCGHSNGAHDKSAGSKCSVLGCHCPKFDPLPFIPTDQNPPEITMGSRWESKEQPKCAKCGSPKRHQEGRCGNCWKKKNEDDDAMARRMSEPPQPGDMCAEPDCDHLLSQHTRSTGGAWGDQGCTKCRCKRFAPWARNESKLTEAGGCGCDCEFCDNYCDGDCEKANCSYCAEYPDRCDQATNESKLAESKVQVKTITLLWAEGKINSPVSLPKTVSTFADANVIIKKIAQEEESDPNRGGYTKMGFKVEFADGETYEGRYDITHQDMFTPDLAKHMREFLGFHAGRWTPPHLTPEKHAEILKTLNVRASGIQDASANMLDMYEI